GFTLPKILWLKKNEPDVFARVGSIIMPKDFIRLKLTDELATDVGDASGTLLFDVDSRSWCPRAFGAVGLDTSLLPKALESSAITGRISKWASTQAGLPEGLLVVGGSGDNQAGAVGAGVVTPGMILATLGTSGVIYAHAARPRKDISGGASGRLHTMCAAN